MDATLESQDQPQPVTEQDGAAAHETAPPGAVVVGVDGSDISMAALAWAAGAARRAGRPLHVISSQDVPLGVGGTFNAMAYAGLAELDDDSRVLEQARRAVAEIAPGLPVTTDRPWGPASHHLVEASRTAWLIVVGNRGMGRVSSTVLGTTSLQTVLHARCPVVVVREGQGEGAQAADSLQVAVGIDGSHDSVAAVEFAFDVAAGGSVAAVMAWWLEVIDGVVVTTPESPQWAELMSRLDGTLQEAVSGAADRHPDVTVSTEAVRGKPAEVLHQAAEGADLLVVGSRGRGGFAGLLLGSVSQHMVTSAPCPVAVMPSRD